MKDAVLEDFRTRLVHRGENNETCVVRAVCAVHLLTWLPLLALQVLSVYSRSENIGEELLSRVHMGRYRSDGYVWHAAIKVRFACTIPSRRKENRSLRYGVSITLSSRYGAQHRF